MKKSLLAVAAIGAFASAAQAQSSVTVYGILDVGFQGVTTRGAASSSTSTAVQNPVGTNGKSNQTRFSGEGAEQTSRLGFKGNEDLGGGTSAFFTVEFALNPTDATLSGSYGNGLANRQSFVGLKKSGIGQAAIGTQYTPIHMAVGRTDPGQQNNMLGNVIYATNASQGSGQTATSYTVRYNNALTLMTDRIAGFQLNAVYNNNNTDTNQTASAGGSTNNNAYGAGLNYVWQKLNVDAAFQASSSPNWSAQQTTGPALPASASTAVANLPANVLGTAINMGQQYYGATYDFGILKAYAGYISAKYSNQAAPSSYLQRTAQQIGVRSFVTPSIEAWASAGTGRFTGQNLAQSAASLVAANSSSLTQNFSGYQLGSNYYLSKRTNLYAIYGSTAVSSSSVAQSEGGSSYGVGVRHTF
ncbi:porin [Polynucleobacter sp.]|uniref:porin n=1 Tax=Polynucleobacter sp. TaxID=2029855 RepID=UPI003F6A4F42